MPKTIDIYDLIQPENLATEIANKMVTWSNSRVDWENSCRETLQYLYATQTTDIMNQPRDYDNTTHIPKLTQIRDLLHTWYHDAIFSLPDFVDWEGNNSDALISSRKNALKAYIRQMLDASGYKDTIDELLADYIDYGNAFAMPVFVNETVKGPNGDVKTIYKGSKLLRINPMDIYFDPSVANFDKAPKIIRSIVTVGELKKMIDEHPLNPEYAEAFSKIINKRKEVRQYLTQMGSERLRNDELQIAGFSNLSSYYASDIVELLTFYGDLYDIEHDKLYDNHKIVVLDRSVVLAKEPIVDLGRGCNILKAGWRDRRDSGWSMSALDNIKGMQYMIDFLENKRADIFNFTSNPIVVTTGDVEMPDTYGPGTEIHCDRDASVSWLAPNSASLAADTYVDRYMALMEEMAGAPKEAAGFRTPGEKTAFEVSQLSNASSRLFNKMTRKFEKEIIEPSINLMLRMFLQASAGTTIQLKEVDPDSGAVLFKNVNVDDLALEGKFVAVGSETFTEKSRMLQSLMQLANTGIFADELVRNWFSPKKIAEIVGYTTGLDKFDGLIKKDARVTEGLEAQQANEVAMQMMDEMQARGLQAAKDQGEVANAE